MDNKPYWMVVWNKITGDFRNAKTKTVTANQTEIAKGFEEEYPGYLVVHIGEGELPPKTYRSLDYIS
ncbi:hypothetical protein QTG56_22360 (plasmid) [Rossellomorea sp. AcN35-11]|nr:hypothetical protein [Rossellomorea aquimaris]WJV32118.1 hypothetical protein QTG56_22360 [Rossellomorea sp. AcN35-11]